MTETDRSAESAESTPEQDRFLRVPTVKESVVRKVFFAKIYFAVIAQYFCLIAVSLACILVIPVRRLIESNGWLLFVFMGVFFAMVLLLSVCHSLRRSYPWNLLALVTLTVFNGLWVGTIVAKYKMYVIIYVLAANAAINSVVSIFAVFSPYDVNSKAMLVLVVISILMVIGSTFSIAYIFSSEIHYFFLGIVATVAASVYYFLVTKMIIRSGEVFHDEWILAVLVIYTAVPHMVVYFIETIGGASTGVSV